MRPALRVASNVLTLTLILVGAAPSAAQRATGEIIGTVTDEAGLSLPGVTVTLRGAAFQGPQIATTSGSGAYRFPVLPPGEYDLEFVLQGFSTLRR
jgi:hypothetical protein